MSDNPNFVNMKFTSFAKKEEYNPPSTAFFGQKQTQTKRPRHVPGGEWAQDAEPEQSTHQPTQTTTSAPINETESKEEAKTKFPFIGKSKKAEGQSVNQPPQVLPTTGILDFAEVRKDA